MKSLDKYRSIVRERLALFLDKVRIAEQVGDQKRRNVQRRVFTVCKQETRMLLEKFSAAGARTAITDYRKALREYDPNSLALNYLKLKRTSGETATSIESEYSRKLWDNMSDLELVENPDALIEQAQLLALSDSYLAKAIGLALLTGRRPVEILKTGEIKLVSKHAISFRGQLKTKKGPSQDWYEIPTLAEASLVCAIWQSLRESKDFSDMTESEVHQKTASPINRTIKSKMDPRYRTKDLRAIYALLTHHKFAPEEMDWLVWYTKVLGHKILREEDGSLADSFLSTAKSYRRYRAPKGWPDMPAKYRQDEELAAIID